MAALLSFSCDAFRASNTHAGELQMMSKNLVQGLRIVALRLIALSSPSDGHSRWWHPQAPSLPVLRHRRAAPE
jgi:hypothetical protein